MKQRKMPLRKCTGCGDSYDGDFIEAKARRFERSLSCKIPDEVYEQMQSELAAADSE